MSFEVFLAKRYLGSARGKGLSVITWIALAGVIVGVMSLITVLGVMSGFDHELREKILGNNAHILVSTFGKARFEETEFEEVLSATEKTTGVSAAMPVVYGEGFLVSSSGDSEGVRIKGVDKDRAFQVLELHDYLEIGDISQFEGPSVILGKALAHKLRVGPGDSITILLNQGEFSPLGLVPKMKRLKVIDVFESGMTTFDATHGYLPLEYSQLLFDEKPHLIEVKTKDPRDIALVKSRIQRALDDRASVQDWLSWNRDLLQALQLEKLVMAIILGLITLVAAFNIAGSLIMIVRDKTRDIAILKSMGCEDQSILKIFFLQGFGIGAVGTFVGCVLGVALAYVLKEYIQFPLNPDVYMIDKVPVDIRIQDILMVALGALGISSLATLYPARLASRIVPVEGLKAD